MSTSCTYTQGRDMQTPSGAPRAHKASVGLRRKLGSEHVTADAAVCVLRAERTAGGLILIWAPTPQLTRQSHRQELHVAAVVCGVDQDLSSDTALAAISRAAIRC